MNMNIISNAGVFKDEIPLDMNSPEKIANYEHLSCLLISKLSYSIHKAIFKHSIKKMRITVSLGDISNKD